MAPGEYQGLINWISYNKFIVCDSQSRYKSL